MSFVNAVKNQKMKGKTVTENGMVTRVSSKSALVDFFFQVGALRGKDVVSPFAKAFKADPTLALKIAQWARDARGGAGERQTFRDILRWLVGNYPEAVTLDFIKNIPNIGRWDDLLVLIGPNVVIQKAAIEVIKEALAAGNGLCAKWMPRKGAEAVTLRNAMGLTPKQYRKMLVSLTKVVETQMCANEWQGINYEHVPSVAMMRYGKAFGKHDPFRFSQFKAAVNSGEAKINASVLFPHDIVRNVRRLQNMDVADLQWKNMPNYVGDANILVMADVSGSMNNPVLDKSGLTPMDVSVALALYCATKNTGKFKDVFMTFSGQPTFQVINSVKVSDAVREIERAQWDMNTDLNAAFVSLLDMARKNKIPKEEMPKAVVIVSDMQFDQCANFTAHKMIKHEYLLKGYDMPSVIFWNVADKTGVPVKFNQTGTALVSGFSPSILKSILSVDLEAMTPEMIMMTAIMSPRYV